MFEPISAATMTTLTLEVIKDVIRTYIVKDSTFDFSPLFYKLMIPFLAFVWAAVLGIVGITDPIAFDVATIVQWAVSILVSLLLYQYGIKPLKDYTKAY